VSRLTSSRKNTEHGQHERGFHIEVETVMMKMKVNVVKMSPEDEEKLFQNLEAHQDDLLEREKKVVTCTR
jgi:ABC-type Zn2+ transport system substrate-binding protein/surface adhesin